MSKIMVVGSLNMDLVVTAQRLPVGGETLMGNEFRQIPGGKGANQAAAMARLGADVEMLGCVGDDSFGTALLTGMADDGVQVTDIRTVKGISTGVALITVQKSGENSIVVVPGANGECSPEYLSANLLKISGAAVLVSQLEIPLETVEMAMATARSSGVYTILNPAPARTLDSQLLKSINLLTPNETELEILSGMPVKTLEQVKAAAEVLFQKGVSELVVTLGAEGSLYLNRSGKVHHQKAYKVIPVDTTAAGDSFTAGLAVKLSEGESIEAAMAFASKVASLTVQKFGAQSSLPYLKEVLNAHFE